MKKEKKKPKITEKKRKRRKRKKVRRKKTKGGDEDKKDKSLGEAGSIEKDDNKKKSVSIKKIEEDMKQIESEDDMREYQKASLISDFNPKKKKPKIKN